MHLLLRQKIDFTMSSFVTDVESPAAAFMQVPGTSLQNDGQEMPLEQASKIKRVLIAVIGIFIGFLTFLPNAMMSTTPAFVWYMAVGASLSFMAGWIYGGWKGEWMYLMPGLCLQLLTIVYVEVAIVKRSY